MIHSRIALNKLFTCFWIIKLLQILFNIGLQPWFGLSIGKQLMNLFIRPICVNGLVVVWISTTFNLFTFNWISIIDQTKPITSIWIYKVPLFINNYSLYNHLSLVLRQDDIIPAKKKRQFLQVGNGDMQRALDFHICSNSDTFIPAISGLFYGNVAGRRIISGRTHILVPSLIVGSSASASDFMSTYISKKNHLAYSCLC